MTLATLRGRFPSSSDLLPRDLFQHDLGHVPSDHDSVVRRGARQARGKERGDGIVELFVSRESEREGEGTAEESYASCAELCQCGCLPRGRRTQEERTMFGTGGGTERRRRGERGEEVDGLSFGILNEDKEGTLKTVAALQAFEVHHARTFHHRRFHSLHQCACSN